MASATLTRVIRDVALYRDPGPLLIVDNLLDLVDQLIAGGATALDGVDPNVVPVNEYPLGALAMLLNDVNNAIYQHQTMIDQEKGRIVLSEAAKTKKRHRKNVMTNANTDATIDRITERRQKLAEYVSYRDVVLKAIQHLVATATPAEKPIISEFLRLRVILPQMEPLRREILAKKANIVVSKLPLPENIKEYVLPRYYKGGARVTRRRRTHK